MILKVNSSDYLVMCEWRSKSFAIQCGRLNVDKFQLSLMLSTHISTVV